MRWGWVAFWFLWTALMASLMMLDISNEQWGPATLQAFAGMWSGGQLAVEFSRFD